MLTGTAHRLSVWGDMDVRANVKPDAIKKQMQSILGDGLVLIVGSGLSAAEGLPGMQELATHLLNTLPGKLAPEHADVWQEVASVLATGTGLEAALTGRNLPTALVSAIANEVACLIRRAENRVYTEVLSGRRTLRFSSLVELFPPSPLGISVVTTNYDRLIELACEAVNRNVDTMFLGDSMGRFDPRESAFSFCRGVRRRQGKVFLEYAPHIRVLKPHGSLDWYSLGGRPARCSAELDATPLIVMPGETKYRTGYNEPFDAHREQSNHNIDQACRYLIIGYGFNDDHLQTHLARNLRDGKPCLVVTKSLTPATAEFIGGCPNTMAVTRHETKNGHSIFRSADGSVYDLEGDFWDLGHLVREVFV